MCIVGQEHVRDERALCTLTQASNPTTMCMEISPNIRGQFEGISRLDLSQAISTFASGHL